MINIIYYHSCAVGYIILSFCYFLYQSNGIEACTLIQIMHSQFYCEQKVPQNLWFRTLPQSTHKASGFIQFSAISQSQKIQLLPVFLRIA